MHVSWKNYTIKAKHKQGAGELGLVGRRSRAFAHGMTLPRNDLYAWVYAVGARITDNEMFSVATCSRGCAVHCLLSG